MTKCDEITKHLGYSNINLEVLSFEPPKQLVYIKNVALKLPQQEKITIRIIMKMRI